MKETEHLQRLCGSKADGVPKQHKLDELSFGDLQFTSPA